MSPLDTSTHWAIVIGIDRYLDGELAPLKGARADARRFHQWLADPERGGVPEAQILHLPATPDAPDPTIRDIEEAFIKLCAPATASRYGGSRLYIYLSGHGVAQDVHEASLLAADGGRKEKDRHVPGWHWLSWFLGAGYFDEVVLFADCCRTVRGSWAVRRFPLDAVNRASPKPVRWVRGFAVQYGGKALEAAEGDGGRGFFTTALLEALEQARAADGTVTAHSLSEYFFNHKKLPEWREYQAPSIISDGEVIFPASTGAPPNQVVVRVEGGGRPTLQGGPRHATRELLRGEHPDEYRAAVPRGIYVAKVPGRKPVLFEVNGGPEVTRVHL